MKKLFTLLFAVALTSGVNAQNRYDVAKPADFTDALTQIAALPEGSAAYVYISGNVDVKTLKSGDGNIMASTLRNIHFIGVDDEEGNRATLRMEMQLPKGNTETSGFSLHFENLRLMQTQGVWGNSKHLMNFKDSDKHYIDTLEFRNCELTELCRSLYRAEAQSTEESAGTMKVFIMENCTVHNGFRQANAMPAIYMAQPVNEMTFRNNTFYDLTYLNSLVSFGTMTDATGRQTVKVIFENNTVCAWSKSSLLNFGSGVSAESEYHIKNNIVMQPTWADDMNNRFGDTNTSNSNMGTINEQVESVDGDGHVTMVDPTNGILTEEEIQARIEKGVVLTGIQGGMAQMENNLLFGYKYQSNKEEIDGAANENYCIPIGDTEEEEVEWSSLSMEDVPFAWTDFADAKNDFFQISNAHPAKTAGKNGAPLGDEKNYTDQVIKIVSLKVSVAGSKSAKVTVSPQKDAYLSGDEVTVIADCNGSLNTFKGWSNGMTEPTITLTLDNDLELTANFEEIEYFAVWNLDDLTANNVVKTPPVAVNYGAGATIDYARYIIPDGSEEGEYKFGEEGCAEYDGAKKAIQTRNNKVSGDVRNCFLITTPNTQFSAGENGKADYLIIRINEDMAASTLKFNAASDNIPYNEYEVSYSADGTTWTVATTFEMKDKSQTNEWYAVEAALPALAKGAQIRIKGIEKSGMAISADMQELIDGGGLTINTEFLFVSEIMLVPGGAKPVVNGDVNGDGTVDVADISNIISVMAGTDTDPDHVKAADVNGDTAVDVSDISNVITIMARQ